jgi:carboxylesterase type B
MADDFNSGKITRPLVHRQTGAPVIVWIHGGGFTGGYKDSTGNPAGLLAESVKDGRSGFVYVQINYRLWVLCFPNMLVIIIVTEDYLDFPPR